MLMQPIVPSIPGLPRQSIVSGIVPAVHLAAFAAASSPVVAMIGDSVSVGPDTTMPMTAKLDPASLANPIAPSELLWTLLKAHIRRQNPGKSISFKNFAVSGQGWANLNGVATANFPTWYTPTSNTWLSFVQAAAPDLVIIALGANDGAGLTATQIKNALTIIAGWTKVPSIVLVSSWHASLAGGILTQTNYLGQRGNGNLIRTICSSHGVSNLMGLTNLPPLGLIDLGRYQQLVEDGTDSAVQRLEQVLTNVSVSAGGNYTLPATDGDYFLDVTWPGAAGVFNFPGMTLSAGDASLTKQYWNIFNNGSTGVGCQLTYSSGAPVTTTRASGNVVDSSKDIRLKLMVKNDHWLALCNGTYFIDELLPRQYDTFQPVITPYGASAAPYVINAYCRGRAVVTQKAISDPATVGNGLDGGNNNNHPGSNGLAYLHAAVIEASNFCVEQTTNLSVVTVTPTTGQSITVPNATGTYIISPAGTLAALTVTLPASGYNIGDTVVIPINQIVTSLTISPNSGQTINGAALTASTVPLGTTLAYRWVAANTWQRVQ